MGSRFENALTCWAERAGKQHRGGYVESGRILGAVAQNHANAGALGKLVRQDDKAGAWAWFLENYPKEAQRIPARTERRRSFLAGVWDAWREE